MSGEKTLDDRIEHIDNELKKLHKELESDLAKYRDSGYLIKGRSMYVKTRNHWSNNSVNTYADYCWGVGGLSFEEEFINENS